MLYLLEGYQLVNSDGDYMDSDQEFSLLEEMIVPGHKCDEIVANFLVIIKQFEDLANGKGFDLLIEDLEEKFVDEILEIYEESEDMEQDCERFRMHTAYLIELFKIKSWRDFYYEINAVQFGLEGDRLNTWISYYYGVEAKKYKKIVHILINVYIKYYKPRLENVKSARKFS
jgi:hypothetical protein